MGNFIELIELREFLVDCSIPDYMHEGILDYVENHIEPGDFLRAVFENRGFVDVVMRADDFNKNLIYQYAQLCYSYIPSGCWGSKEAVDNWIKNKEE